MVALTYATEMSGEDALSIARAMGIKLTVPCF